MPASNWIPFNWIGISKYSWSVISPLYTCAPCAFNWCGAITQVFPLPILLWSLGLTGRDEYIPTCIVQSPEFPDSAW